MNTHPTRREQIEARLASQPISFALVASAVLGSMIVVGLVERVPGFF